VELFASPHMPSCHEKYLSVPFLINSGNVFYYLDIRMLSNTILFKITEMLIQTWVHLLKCLTCRNLNVKG
jgi:site-specific DNA-adenine methylase